MNTGDEYHHLYEIYYLWLSADKAGDDRYHQKDQKQVEQYLCDTCRCASNTRKTEYTRNYGDSKKISA